MKALVIGGTGASGPAVVEGLLDRGYEVSIFHSGQHEVGFTRPVEHLHGDPHFLETIEETIGKRTFDLIVCMYGRLRVAAEAMQGRTGRFIAVGAASGYVGRTDPAWGPLGQPFAPDEEGPRQTDPEADKFAYLINLSEQKVFEAHHAGACSATLIRPVTMYGPSAPTLDDWCLVRRIRDGRRRLIIADGGIKVLGRLFGENCAAAVLLAVDKPVASAGRAYNVTDEHVHTMRQRIDLVARALGHEFELVDLPYPLAKPCHVLWRYQRDHRVVDDGLIRRELGHRDAVPAAEAIVRTVRWLMEHPPRPGGEEEVQLGDPFDYAAEDALIRAWEGARSRVEAVPFQLPAPAHRYRHPKTPGEAWKRPESSSRYTQHVNQT